jgi:beta-glucosidase
VTFPQSDADLPHPVLPGTGVSMPNPFADLNNFPAFSFVIHYDEGLKVGYRWYESEGKKPLFPFGYGLSYTKFLYAGMQADGGDGLNLSFAVQNVGMRAGEEVAQVYVTYPRAAGEPGKKLVGWEKISLAAGETKSVKIRVDPMYVSVFDVQQDKWKIVPGDYTVQAGGSSVDLPLKAVVGMGK